MKPTRVQLSRARGWKMPANTINVARPGKWGNPFRAIDPANPDHVRKAVHYFRQWLSGSHAAFEFGPQHGVAMVKIPAWTVPGNLRAQLQDLMGKNLACWCRPGATCHADVLLELANS